MHSKRPSTPLLSPLSLLVWLAHEALWLGIASLFALGALLLTTAELALAQLSSFAGSDPTAAHLTKTLVSLTTQYQQAAPTKQPQLLKNLSNVATARQQFLAALIESDPGEVLRVAVPAALRSSLPPEVQAYVEEEVTVEGLLEVLHEDGERGSRYLHFLQIHGQRLSLHFAGDAPSLLTGSRVRVSGVRVKQALALASGPTSVTTLSVALPGTFGAQRTLVLLVNFQNSPIQPYTVDYARNVVFGTTGDYYWGNSYEQTWLTGEVYGWYTVPFSIRNATECNVWKIMQYAQAAARAAGIDLSAYSRYVYAIPQVPCGWWGLGTLGGNPSQAWVKGRWIQSTSVGHELGHNLGLYHSHALDCGTTVLGTNCTTIEYGDSLDLMGSSWESSSLGHFNSARQGC